MEHAVGQILLLLLIACMVGMGARRVNLPYTLALVLTGIALGFFHFEQLEGLHLTPDLLLAILLPALLFEAAYHVDFEKFAKAAIPILILAVPGVLLAVAVTAGATYGLFRLVGAELSLGHAVLFASMIAATDPISVLALFKTLGVDKKLYLLVEGESLLNDGVAVVVFVIVAAVLGIETGHGHAPHLDGAADVLLYGLRTFGWMAGMGVAIGSVMGLVVSVLTRQVDDRLIETTLSFVLAYGSFILAEELHASGVLSCVAAGMVLGSFGSRFGMSAPTRVAIVDFWEFMAFFANSFVFLLVGIELDIPELVGDFGLVSLAFGTVLLGRAVSVYGLLPLGRFFSRAPTLDPRWKHVMFWGGLRGSLSMVLVIGLPADMPGRELLLHLVFGVVSVSLFLHGLTIKSVLARLGITEGKARQHDYQQARARAIIARKALKELARQRESGSVEPAVAEVLEGHYRARREASMAESTRLAGDSLHAERLQEAAFHLLTIEEEALRHAAHEGIIADDAAEPLLTEIARKRETLRHGDDSPEALQASLEELLGHTAARVAEGGH